MCVMCDSFHALVCQDLCNHSYAAQSRLDRSNGAYYGGLTIPPLSEEQLKGPVRLKKTKDPTRAVKAERRDEKMMRHFPTLEWGRF